MADDRKQTIINEIKYWKTNRLLPAEYCDYLLALYSEGDGSHDGKQAAVLEKPRSSPISAVFLVLTLILLPLSFLVIYFTEMDMIMQTGLLSSFVLIAFIHAIRLNYARSMFFQFPLIIGLLIALLLTVSVISHYSAGNTAIFVSVPFHSLIWFYIGWKLKLKYLQISGVIGMLLVTILIVL
ncbi:hypothetical protein [Halobacillus yeomjeoni]|uniref:Uncharacterized protein n=1 Tax=Halobacillus yeomjeoni TaxID=311194 RepID=A0A931HUR6_9BACI|nr:hypothetical protein [Halobacillus yeomjeoni]MBH0229900.1 hypothetical protein [Halobacillus yeomjeoni]